MSGIGAIGGAGGIGMSGGMSCGASCGVGAAAPGASLPGSAPGSTQVGAGLPPNMQSLVQTFQDFSSAEILLALMIASAAERNEKKCSGGGGGFLAGLAMAGMLANMQNMGQSAAPPPMSPAGAGSAGMSLNVSV